MLGHAVPPRCLIISNALSCRRPAEKEPEEESGHHNAHGQRPDERVVAGGRVQVGQDVAQAGGRAAQQSHQERGARLPAPRSHGYGGQRRRAQPQAPGPAGLLRQPGERDALKEAHGLRLALLQARGRERAAAPRLPRDHQTPHGPQQHQGVCDRVVFCGLRQNCHIAVSRGC